MTTISYSVARATLADTINSVIKNRDPIMIKKKNDTVVMMSLDDYRAWAETVYLLRSPKNAKRLIQAMDALECGRDTIEKSLEALVND